MKTPLAITIFPSVKGTLYPNQSTRGKVVTVKGIRELEQIIIKQAWAPSIFRGNIRGNDQFLYSHFMGLDFDDGTPIESVKKRLLSENIDASITLTRHHMKKKDGKPTCPRFRVVIPLDEPVISREDFSATWLHLKGLFPEVDRQCKDPARFFFASVNGKWRADG